MLFILPVVMKEGATEIPVQPIFENIISLLLVCEDRIWNMIKCKWHN